MAKFEQFTLNLNDGEILNFEQLGPDEQEILKNGNIIYIYKSSKNRKIYIGKTKHFITRHKQHYSGKEEKFNSANFDKVKVLISRYFNGSALDDVENQLITYFKVDNSKVKPADVLFDNDEIINGNNGNYVNDYTERERVSAEVILPFWENVLFPEGWVNTHRLDNLRNSSLVKYSPIKQLSEEQVGIIQEIFDNPNKNYVINGDAGTGKTVLLTHLVKKYITASQKKKIAVIVQPNWEETAIEIFNVFGIQSSNLNISTSTKFITQGEEYDVIIVDESHKLSRKYPKQLSAFNNVYNNEKFSDCENHLEPIKILGNQIILMYDVLQAIRPANILREKFQELTSSFEQRYLTTQFRIRASRGEKYTSDDYVNGIKYLLYKDTGLLKYTNFDENFDRSLFREDNINAYFGYFEDKPLKNMINWLERDKNYNPEHINRILSGLVEDWKQADGKHKSIRHFFEDDISRRWNSTQKNWINSSEDDAEEQIGSVFAVQGIDLNKVGVLIGKDLLVDEEGKLYGEPSNFKNVNGKHTKEELEIPEIREEFTIFVLNIYYILLTRGIDGVRIGFWDNEDFKNYFKKTFDIV